jgi:hypothetical protein
MGSEFLLLKAHTFKIVQNYGLRYNQGQLTSRGVSAQVQSGATASRVALSQVQCRATDLQRGHSSGTVWGN